MYEEQSVALANLATTTSSDRKALETLTNTVANLTSELKTKDTEIKSLKNQMQQNRGGDKDKENDRGKSRFTPQDMGSYCWSHGYLIWKNHKSCNCRFPKEGHKKEATRENNMGGNQEGKPV